MENWLIEKQNKIEELERQGIFDVDIENDPETLILLPDDIDYLHTKLSTKIKSYFAIKLGGIFFKKQIKCGNLVVKEIKGIENLPSKDQAVIVTCNHFHPFDNYIVLMGIKKSLRYGRFYKVIREGNYTNPPKGFEMFMRYGDTLPLSSNAKTMVNFLSSVKTLLKRRKKILIYPEQAMWWNYRKPRPLKNGAFKIASTNKVAVLPIFVTMKDIKGKEDGTQEYTVNICPIINYDSNLSQKENEAKMMETNYKLWVDIYEKTYNTKLKYLCDEKEEKEEK